jgi:hypothetical protein
MLTDTSSSMKQLKQDISQYKENKIKDESRIRNKFDFVCREDTRINDPEII